MEIRPHRYVYVQGKLEFSIFFDKTVTNKDQILKDFLESSMWKDYERVYSKKFNKAEVSKDLFRIDIGVK